jgi:hypothetical protein
MRRNQRGRRDPDYITASELASFAYCQERYRLAELGLEPGNRAALDAGMRRHARQATADRVAGGTIGMGRLLIMVGLVALLLALWLVWR